MAINKTHSLINKDRIKRIADEHDVGGYFEGESNRERKVGVQRVVVVDIFKRPPEIIGTQPSYFVRVSLRSKLRPYIIHRWDVDVDHLTNEREFLSMVTTAAGALAENDIEKYGPGWNPDEVAKEGLEAGKEFLSDFKQKL